MRYPVSIRLLLGPILFDDWQNIRTDPSSIPIYLTLNRSLKSSNTVSILASTRHPLPTHVRNGVSACPSLSPHTTALAIHSP